MILHKAGEARGSLSHGEVFVTRTKIFDGQKLPLIMPFSVCWIALVYSVSVLRCKL